ncbi:MAG: HDOD domain-containing protein [Candidatus Eisenbacteria bacterium]|uniref:HDOD domain-containing protein n=1 Tax=Eiseniibacteriota bacterium TaxID=2212470 RepID=A0A956LWD6_UNCEI|nr:HDOD domain-containing protein [Candidatus Eisenbacteria bacterium]
MDQTAQEVSRIKLQQALATLEHLPPMPEILIRLLQVLEDPDSTVDQVAEVVSTDAALSLSLIRLVNSASFGLIRRLTDIREAVQFVGTNETKNLAIAVAVKTGLIGRMPSCHAFDRFKLWRHFVGTALGAHALACRLRHPAFRSAFTAGLLHDIGLVVLDRVFPHDLQFIVSELERKTVTLEEAEQHIIGFSHGEVGVWLGEQWDIPRTLLAPMLHHERPWEGRRDAGLCALVAIADWLAMSSDPFYKSAYRPPLDPKVFEAAGTTEDILVALRTDLAREMDRMATLLELT